MKFHTDVLIFEIVKLYVTVSGLDYIPLINLGKAFYMMQDIIDEKEDIYTNFSFEEELDKLLENYGDSFSVQFGRLILNDNLEDIFGDIINNHEIMTEIDYDTQEYVHNVLVYKALNLDIPIKEMEEYFKLNSLIIRQLLKLGQDELMGKVNVKEIYKLKNYLTSFKDMIDDLDNNKLEKLKMCCAHYNSLYLLAGDEHFKNSSWNIILFNYKPKLFKSLNYEMVEYVCAMIDEISSDEDIELMDEFMDEEEEEELTSNDLTRSNIDFEEIPLFLTYFMINLNKYIKNNPDSLAKEGLLVKKYLLLAIPELEDILDYYIKNYTIDTFNYPNVPNEWFNESSFEIIKPKVMEALLSLDYSDDEIKAKPYLYTKVITNALFVQCFKNLSINSNSKKDIDEMIKSFSFYKNPCFTMVTDVIDNIIYNNEISLNRR